MDTCREIYAQLETLSEPAALPAFWSDFPVPADYRNAIRDFRIVSRTLRKSFSDDELTSAGALGARPGLQ
jgi:hypothetical protein